MNLPVLAFTGALALAALSAHAESFTSSASSTASSAASSASDSLRASSNSSSKTTAQVDDGDYRIEAVAVLAEKPGYLRLTLQAPGRSGEHAGFLLDLPQRSFEAQGLARGDLLSARQRPYGLAFARVDAREPFFLVLADEWHGQLDPRKL